MKITECGLLSYLYQIKFLMENTDRAALHSHLASDQKVKETRGECGLTLTLILIEDILDSFLSRNVG